MKLYDMEMVFDLTYQYSFFEYDDDIFKIPMKNEIKINQTINFIPSEEMIQKYEKVMEENIKKKTSFKDVSVKFSRYNKLLEKEV